MLTLFKALPKVEARAAATSILVGVALLGIKFAAYFLTGSTAIFADALEGIVNVATSAITLYALMLAHRPPDEEHPYGHGKVEFFSAGLEGGMILLAAVIAVGKAASSLVHGTHLDLAKLAPGLGLMCVAMVVNGVLGSYLIRAGRRQASAALEADGWHLISDAITSVGALIALVIVWLTHWEAADPVIAIIVSIYIAWTGLRLIRSSAGGLMDEQDARDDAMIRKILDGHLGPAGKEPLICSYHKLRHRHSGRYHWVDFHIMLPGSFDIETGHRTASAIEYEIEQGVGQGNATAHIEPCKTEACANCQEALAKNSFGNASDV